MVEKTNIMSKYCKSCNSILSGEWCHLCGQPVKDTRITIRNAISNFFAVIFNIETGFLNTVFKMTVDPGTVISDFISGKTKPYFGPFRFAFTTLTILLIVYQFYDYDELMYTNESQIGDELSLKLQEFVLKYSNILTPILFIPFMGLASFILNKKSGYNYAENFILMLYISGQTAVYLVLLTPLVLVSEQQNVISSTINLFAYIVIIYQFCLCDNSKLRSLVKSIAIPLLGLGLFMVFIVVISITIGFLWRVISGF